MVYACSLRRLSLPRLIAQGRYAYDGQAQSQVRLGHPRCIHGLARSGPRELCQIHTFCASSRKPGTAQEGTQRFMKQSSRVRDPNASRSVCTTATRRQWRRNYNPRLTRALSSSEPGRTASGLQLVVRPRGRWSRVPWPVRWFHRRHCQTGAA
jgi:hypothetical protein